MRRTDVSQQSLQTHLMHKDELTYRYLNRALTVGGYNYIGSLFKTEQKMTGYPSEGFAIRQKKLQDLNLSQLFFFSTRIH